MTTQLIFEQVKTDGDRNFGYLIADKEEKTGAIVDPSYRPEHLVRRAEAQGLKITYIINTHGHIDHTHGNDIAKRLTGAAIIAYKNSDTTHDIGIDDNQEIKIGGLKLKVFFTPGHADDHIVLFNKEFSFAITGDHLFVGKIGGTATKEAAKMQYESLIRLFQEMPEHTTVWPGHDFGCRPSSTLLLEKTCNPFLQEKDLNAFYAMKENWALYKAENGLL